MRWQSGSRRTAPTPSTRPSTVRACGRIGPRPTPAAARRAARRNRTSPASSRHAGARPPCSR
eukprot:11159868-Lingulodinium_polyedra.AAC.1